MAKFKDATRRQSRKMITRAKAKAKKAAWRSGAKARGNCCDDDCKCECC